MYFFTKRGNLICERIYRKINAKNKKCLSGYESEVFDFKDISQDCQ